MFKKNKDVVKTNKKRTKKPRFDSESDDNFCKNEINEHLLTECCCSSDWDPLNCTDDECFRNRYEWCVLNGYSSDCNNNLKAEKPKKILKKIRKRKAKKKVSDGSSVSSSTKKSGSKKSISGLSNSSSSTSNTVIQRASATAKNYPNEDISNQLKYSGGKSFSTNDLAGMKGNCGLKKPKLQKKYPKLCAKFTREVLKESGFQNLCDRFKSSSLTELLPITSQTTVKNIVQLSDHDRKILDRMSMKRTKEIALQEDAIVARKYWELEKNEREIMRNKQLEEYFRLVQMKREHEQLETVRRKQVIAEKQKEYSEKIQQEITAKTLRAENILKNLEIEREISECKKRHREFMRMESILANFEEHRLNEDIWRQTINDRMEERFSKAEHVRNKIMDVQKVRIQMDNQIEQQIHAANFEETKKIEEFKTEKLKEKINERDHKYKRFAEQRRKVVEDSKNQAKTSALLRELLKRSFSTDCFRIQTTPSQQRSYSSNLERRPISNLSYHSQISSIHLS